MKIVFVSNIPSPYQVKWASIIRHYYDIEFWFMNTIDNSLTGRPSYWNVEMPEYCKVLPSKFKYHEICYGPTIKRELDNFDPDVIWLGGAWYMFAWMQAYSWARKRRKKIIVGPLEFARDSYNIKKMIKNQLVYKKLYKNVDAFLCNNFTSYDILNSIVPEKKKYIFMNAEDYRPYLLHPTRNPQKIVTFFYGGAFTRKFKVPELLNTFRQIGSSISNVRLLLAGYGPEKSLCERIINDSATLSEKVGWHEVNDWIDIPKAYSKADVFVINTDYSSGSFSTMYAIASGMGVVSNINVASARHYIIHGYNGFLFDNNRDLQKYILMYAEQPSIIYEHGERSKVIAQNETYQRKMEIFTEMIESLEVKTTN